ncbi:16353_t:CDS:2, partial [Funneliformis geosporum]
DMSDKKRSLKYLPIYSFLFSNEKGSSLYNVYDQDEVVDKLVIKIDQDDRAPKFSIADDISEVYDLPGIYKCINGQKPLRAVIDIDTSKVDMETADILKGLIITTSSDPSKCSYHILYAPALLIDHHELKAFTELVYSLTGEKFGKYIDRGLPGHNFNLRLVSSAKKGLEVRPQILSTEKNNDLLRISIEQDILQKYADLILQKYSKYLRNWIIEEKEETKENLIYFN